jgi:hypothetical protein
MMARRDLTNAEIEAMGKANPGSAAEYLNLRRQELAAEKEKERETQAFERFKNTFVSSGGSVIEAKAAYDRQRNQSAEAAAKAADEEAYLAHSRRMRSVV